MVVVSRCCFWKANGETVEHFLLHCPVAKDLWSSFLSIFGVSWVMPRHVGQLPMGNMFGKHRVGKVWKMVRHCVLWCLWRERNARTLEDNETSMIRFKWLCLSILFDWAKAHVSTTCDTLLGFVDSFHFCVWFSVFCVIKGFCLSIFPVYYGLRPFAHF